MAPCEETAKSRVTSVELGQTRLFSYVVARDYGFAPNPFYGLCTLATCKPVIRRVASVGDWIVGTSSTKAGAKSRLIFAMQVGKRLTFNEYWASPPFARKKPNLRGSAKQAYGDNIYHRDPATGAWIQEPSHHSKPDNTPNLGNLKTDTSTDVVLIADYWTYFGRFGPSIPDWLEAQGLLAGRGHRSDFSEDTIKKVIAWLLPMGNGYKGDPEKFK